MDLRPEAEGAPGRAYPTLIVGWRRGLRRAGGPHLLAAVLSLLLVGLGLLSAVDGILLVQL